jgi:hypothetical protein
LVDEDGQRWSEVRTGDGPAKKCLEEFQWQFGELEDA